jgi:hypothetical protein
MDIKGSMLQADSAMQKYFNENKFVVNHTAIMKRKTLHWLQSQGLHAKRLCQDTEMDLKENEWEEHVHGMTSPE